VDATDVPAPAPDGEHGDAGERGDAGLVGTPAHRIPTATAASAQPLVRAGKQAPFGPLPRGQRSR
jgi:hypothetical protein